MANQIPVKAIYSGSDVTSLGEFTASDDITITYLPTGTSSSTVALGDHTHATYLPLAGGTMTGTIATFTSTGIDDNATSTAITIDSSENVGIGVTPESWRTTTTALEVGGNGNINTYTAEQAGNHLQLMMNGYHNGTEWKYKSTDEASRYMQKNGVHTFSTAASGSADAAITWTSAMTIDNSGNVGIGTSSPSATLEVDGNAVAKTNTDTSNSGTVDLDFAANQNFVLTLTGAITSLTASNEVVGQSGFIAFIQDGTGGRTVALHGDYETPAAAGLTLTTTASATDLVPYLVVASSRILLGTPQLAFA